VNRYVNPAADLQIDGVREQSIDLLPLSAAQLGIWFAHKTSPSAAAYNIGEYVEIKGPIDPLLFERALRIVLCEAETLHVQILEPGDGQPRQFVGTPPGWSMAFVDLSGEPDARAAAEAWMKADLAQPIEPSCVPLFGFALFKAAADRFFWYARYHHVVMDAFGMWLVARRLAQIYSHLSSSGSTDNEPFPPLAVLLKEDSAYRSSEQFTQDAKYWCDYLADRPRPISLGAASCNPSNGVLRRTTYLPLSTRNVLRSLAERTGTSLSRVLGAAFAILLHRRSGETDLVFGLPVTARAGAARSIPAMTSNVLPLRLIVHPSMTVAEVVAQARSQIQHALEHQAYQIADVSCEVRGLG
jgi:hypothetical protein